jgi:hypothetical protein
MTPEAILQLPWVMALRPQGYPYLDRLSAHSDFLTWHIRIELAEWQVPPSLATRWKEDTANNNETWRKRPLLRGDDSGCDYSCGEVEIAARLRKAGFQSRWVSEWGSYEHVPCWRPFCVKRRELEDSEPELWAADNNLRERSKTRQDVLGRTGGHPDVAAWHSQRDIVYVEYKGPGDRVNKKQDAWAQEVIAQNPGRFCYLVAYGTIIGRS